MHEDMSKSEDGKLYASVTSELDSDGPNIEEYLFSESLPQPHGKLHLYISLPFFFLHLTIYLQDNKWYTL